jgi:hypothetical protein
VSRFAVRLEVRTARPLTPAQLDGLDGGRYQLQADGRPRSRSLAVALEMAGGDVAGALARSLNVVLDQVPGVVRHAEVTELRRRPSPARPRGP